MAKETGKEKLKRYGKNAAGFVGGSYGLSFLGELLSKLPMKDGGRVKGVGKATHGYGKAIKKQGKK